MGFRYNYVVVIKSVEKRFRNTSGSDKKSSIPKQELRELIVEAALTEGGYSFIPNLSFNQEGQVGGRSSGNNCSARRGTDHTASRA